ncbi:MAG TPA: Rrf2 family transcriptional regulator [Flavobacteriales bacterium]|nr:Rrf2 family transcriptional regulator [Flavobacteriales bacterium]HRO41073.1 Rrf2 family transcriptional regulator [Flavobacteriales bacterium]HRP81751.1 Rrf2 family transcriptional regulator [Flavobacteriales bacterium]HRQ84907.1 Rrf2 family transcriptional regulator [Flavobacteriales bacterium]
MFSKTYHYALRATVVVALASKRGQRATLPEIAAHTGAPKAFMAKVLQDLVRGGILSSRRGPNGGFGLAPERAEGMSLSKIADAVGGENVTRNCVMGLAQCDENRPCPLHKDFCAVKETVTRLLASTKVSDLVDGLDRGTTHVKR